jgi:hypothetical protein
MMLQTQDFALFILLYSSFSLFITGLLRSYPWTCPDVCGRDPVDASERQWT